MEPILVTGMMLMRIHRLITGSFESYGIMINIALIWLLLQTHINEEMFMVKGPLQCSL